MISIWKIGRHQRLRTLLSSYVDGQVTLSEAARIEAHLSGCERCGRDLDNLRATVGVLRALPELAIPRSFALGFAPEPVAEPWPFARAAAAVAAAAAVLLIALLAGDLAGLLEQTGRVADEDASVRPEAVAAMAAEEAGREVDVTVESEIAVERKPAAAEGEVVVVEKEVIKAVAQALPVEKAVAESEVAVEPPAAVEPSPREETVAAAAPTADDQPEVAPSRADGAGAAPAEGQPQDAVILEAPGSVATEAAEPEVAAAPTLLDQDDAEPQSRTVDLPLRELELALAAILAVLAMVTLTLVRRRNRL